jgi:hypothetical protein
MEQCLDEQPRNSQPNAPLPVLEGIEEEGVPAEKWPPTAVRPPETPTEFLARSWSLSAAEISKALKVLGSKATSDAPAMVATTTAEQSGEAVGAMSPANLHASFVY